MKVYIDFSVFIRDSIAYGRALGVIDMPTVPRVGDKINFSIKIPKSLCVENVTFFPGEDVSVMLGLENLVIENFAEALICSDFLKESFNIFIDKYELE